MTLPKAWKARTDEEIEVMRRLRYIEGAARSAANARAIWGDLAVRLVAGDHLDQTLVRTIRRDVRAAAGRLRRLDRRVVEFVPPPPVRSNVGGLTVENMKAWERAGWAQDWEPDGAAPPKDVPL